MSAPLKNPLEDDLYDSAEEQLEDMREALLDAIDLVGEALDGRCSREEWVAEAQLFLAMFPEEELLEDEV